MDNLAFASKTSVNKVKVENKVKAMYREVANNPHGDFHFEMGRSLALRLQYEETFLNIIPFKTVDSFAGVGHHFNLANIIPGERILDLGSGSGMDAFIASLKTGTSGEVTGIDMTNEQLDKANELALFNGYNNISFRKSYIENIPDGIKDYDLVISNGVINLSPAKSAVFNQISKVLKKGGRMAISDIVTESQMPDSITCNSTLWAACIGGALPEYQYFSMIEDAGLRITNMVENRTYKFISKSAIGASKQYGVKSISVLAEKI